MKDLRFFSIFAAGILVVLPAFSQTVTREQATRSPSLQLNVPPIAPSLVSTQNFSGFSSVRFQNRAALTWEQTGTWDYNIPTCTLEHSFARRVQPTLSFLRGLTAAVCLGRFTSVVHLPGYVADAIVYLFEEGEDHLTITCLRPNQGEHAFTDSEVMEILPAGMLGPKGATLVPAVPAPAAHPVTTPVPRSVTPVTNSAGSSEIRSAPTNDYSDAGVPIGAASSEE